MQRAVITVVLLACAGTIAEIACSSFGSDTHATNDDAGADANVPDVGPLPPTDGGADSEALDATAPCGTLDGGIAFWPMNEGDGGTANDCIGGHAGTLTGDVTWLGVDAGGPGLTFADGGHLELAFEPSLQLGDVPFTISVWARFPDAQVDITGNILSRLNGGVVNWAFGVHGTQAVFSFIEPPSAPVNYTSTSLASDVWTHLAVVYAPTTSVVIYVNGMSAATNALTQTMMTDGGSLTIGQNPDGTERFGGQLRGLALFNRALAPLEIQTLATP